MDKNRKKELQEKYKNLKTEMGIYMIRSQESSRIFLGYSQDLKSIINRHKFSIDFGKHHFGPLQEELSKYGGASFEIKKLEVLDYDEDESKTDYSEELDLLLEIWKEKFDDVVVIL